jgi:hypothetical protein
MICPFYQRWKVSFGVSYSAEHPVIFRVSEWLLFVLWINSKMLHTKGRWFFIGGTEGQTWQQNTPELA